MKNIAIILFVLLGLTQAVKFCCSGTFDPNNPNNFDGLSQPSCPDGTNAVCTTNTISGDPTNSSSLQNLACGSDSSTGSTCNTDYCNCPSGFNTQNINNNNNNNNNTTGRDPIFGSMKSIMYPVMGVIFGIVWVILAFIGSALPLDLLLFIVGFIDAVFGLFLIFIPLTTFLGLFYMAVGAFTIAITRHAWGGDTGIDFLLALTIIIFLLTGGLTFVAFDSGLGANYIDRMAAYTPFCDQDMDIYQNTRSTRCQNYAFFVTFCVFLLFLIQPIGMIAAAFKRVGRHHDTTVVVNEKHKSENKNTV
jgi:fumarate reductase subunit D